MAKVKFKVPLIKGGRNLNPNEVYDSTEFDELYLSQLRAKGLIIDYIADSDVIQKDDELIQKDIELSNAISDISDQLTSKADKGIVDQLTTQLAETAKQTQRLKYGLNIIVGNVGTPVDVEIEGNSVISLSGIQHLQNPLLIGESENLLPPFNEWTLHTNTTLKNAYEIELNATASSQLSTVRLKVIPDTQYTFSIEEGQIFQVNSYDQNNVGTGLVNATSNKVVTFKTPSNAQEILVVLSNGTILGKVSFKKPILTLGTVLKPFSPRNPSYLYAELSLSKIDDKKDLLFYQQGNWKVKKEIEKDTILDGSLSWTHINGGFTGYKLAKATLPNGAYPGATGGIHYAVKHSGQLLTAYSSAWDKGDLSRIAGSTLLNEINITIPNTDSGFVNGYVPVTEEIKAYFNGWKVKTADANNKPTSWASIVDNSDAPVQTVAYVSANRAANYTPYKVSYALSKPIIEIVIDKVQGKILAEGSTQIDVRSGAIPKDSNDIKKGFTFTSGSISDMAVNASYATNNRQTHDDLTLFVGDIAREVSTNKKLIGDLQKITKAPATKRDLEIIVPHNVYTVANDITTNPIYGRNYTAGLVIDHMFNLNEYDKDLWFKGKTDTFSLQAPFVNDGTDAGVIVNRGVTVNKESVTLEFESDDFNTVPKQVKHISTKSSAGKTKKAFVLTIGDSISNGHLADINRIDEVKPNQLVYWAKVKKLFEMDKIDGGDNTAEHNVYFLGQKTRRDIKIDYKGKSRTVTANAEAYGGWSLYSMLRHQNLTNGSQATWDMLGLGNGSGTDYTGSQAQRDLIASTNENFAGMPVNPFFDNNKTGANRFSIAKWLERYRTMDDNGNRLTLGNGTGTQITSTNLNTIDVCTPTHVYLQMGANDLGGRTTPEKFLSNVQEFVSTVREQLPNAIIGISLTQDYAGTFFPARFKEFDNCRINYWGHDFHYKSAKLLLDWFKNKDEATEKLFLIPNFFVQPNAYSMPYIKYDSPEADTDDLMENKVRLVKYGAGPDIHPNYNAHAAWAYQVYAWLKYSLTLS